MKCVLSRFVVLYICIVIVCVKNVFVHFCATIAKSVLSRIWPNLKQLYKNCLVMP